jgi:hypothetical protein
MALGHHRGAGIIHDVMPAPLASSRHASSAALALLAITPYPIGGIFSVELTITLSYILLAVAAVALVAFFVTWSRRSKPTGTQSEPIRVTGHPSPSRVNHHDPHGEA